ncbi:MAG: hypothetical protein JNK45_32675, partial [Myxococcales bacterium]|nr:hypothetical protein [Myxococcales bacterium]
MPMADDQPDVPDADDADEAIPTYVRAPAGQLGAEQREISARARANADESPSQLRGEQGMAAPTHCSHG